MSGQLEDLKEVAFSTPLTFDNGLTRTLDNVQLGGDLIKPTIIGETNSVQDLITNSFWIKNHTAIGEEAPLDNLKLKVSSYGNFNVDGGTSLLDRVFNSSNISAEVDKEAYSITSRLLVYNSIVGTNTDNTIIPSNFGELGSSLRGSILYRSPTADVTSAISCISSSHFLTAYDEPNSSGPQPAGGGDITSLIGFIARSPRQLADNPSGNRTGLYNGTISDTFGLFIEPQKSQDANIGTAQTRTWGIYQTGATDGNKLYGSTSIGPFSFNDDAQLTVSRASQHNFKSQGINSYFVLSQNRT